MKNFLKMQEEYAHLLLEVGVNLQKGQPLMLRCPLEGVQFAKIIVRHAYTLGAKEVVIDWYDDELTLLKYQHAPLEVFEKYPPWQVEKSKYYLSDNAAILSIFAEDPFLLQEVDSQKIAVGQKAAAIARKEIRKYTMNDICSWTLASIPCRGWAKRLFPELSEEAAVKALWVKIFEATRITQSNPIVAWRQHIANMNQLARFLNDKNFSTLHYQSANGTDLTVELPKGHVWISTGSVNENGTPFVANIPSEEVYTLPKKDGVNGQVFSTRPLHYGGNIIDGISFVFANGKVVDYSAKIGQKYLDDLFAVDENAKYLGEVALVPYDSPISQSKLVFINTLFDENASCHFALGKAYPTTLKDGIHMSETELSEAGVNDALIHEDFMIGTPDLSIIGITHAGDKIPIFQDGNWAKQ